MIGKPVIKIEVQDWDKLVKDTYGRPYTFQQQDHCKSRGIHEFSVPMEYPDDYENDTVPEKVNDPDMGVSFEAWLERDPKQLLVVETEPWSLALWWDRNFYPCVDQIINDLHSKGLLPEGEYAINIDW
jgi:hypothetical protein